MELRVGPVDAYVLLFLGDIRIHICFRNIMISSLKKERDVGTNRRRCLLVGLVYGCHEALLDSKIAWILILDLCIVHVKHHNVNLPLG